MEKTTKILGGYVITLRNDTFIEKLTKENKNTRFSYKFYERHKEKLDAYVNIQDFVKEAQNRDTQDRVSVNLKNGKTNTTDAEKLVLASVKLLLAVESRVESTALLQNIIAIAKQKLVEFDSVLLDLIADEKKLQSLAQNIGDIFGTDSDNYLQVIEKRNAVTKSIKERAELLTKSV